MWYWSGYSIYPCIIQNDCCLWRVISLKLKEKIQKDIKGLKDVTRILIKIILGLSNKEILKYWSKQSQLGFYFVEVLNICSKNYTLLNPPFSKI